MTIIIGITRMIAFTTIITIDHQKHVCIYIYTDHIGSPVNMFFLLLRATPLPLIIYHSKIWGGCR